MNKTMKTALAVAAVSILSLTSLSSCHIYKKYETPASSELTRAYADALEAPEDSAALGNLPWEQVFTDPQLQELIACALANNTNLRNAQLNIEAARAGLKGARLAYLPSIALAPNGAGVSYAGSKLSWTYTIPAQASWEIDIFGKLLNGKRSAQAQVLQSEAYAQAVRSQIIGGVATTYYALAAVKDQLALSRSTAVLWKESVETMRNLKLAGRVTEAAVVQSEANYYSILGSITDLEVSLDQLYNTMSLLLNTLPQKWQVADRVDLVLPADYQEGVQMKALSSRPDVRAAEQSLAVAYYATNSARAAFYPGLTINFNGGFTNLLGSMVKNPGDWFYQLAGSLVAPLFARGQNIARLEATKAQQQQAMNTFEYTLMSAAAEVGDALTVYAKSIEKSEALRNQVAALEKSVEYTNDLLLYSTGQTTYLEVLTAQQSLLAAKISQINTDLARAKAVVSLYQSLGGGR
ncbi:MAG: TolC family protein [Muribaculaceae bacterium]|nr:TolC family protein [Muribaculaceae bacterium]